MLLPIAQLGSYADDKHSTILLADGILTLFRTEVRVHPEQFLTVDKVYLTRKERLDLRTSLTGEVFRAKNSIVNLLAHTLSMSSPI